MRKRVEAEDKTSGINRHILNIITPPGVDFDNTHANLGENTGKIYCISKYPTEGVDYGWLSELCNLEGTASVIEYRYTNPANIVGVFDKKIAELQAEQDLARKQSEAQQLEQAVKDLKDMIHRISVLNEPVGYVNVMLHIQDVNETNLGNRIKRVGSIAGVNGCSIMNLKYKQKTALQCMAPYGMPNPEVSNMGERNMPMSSFVGGFPMANSGINDAGGYYIAKTIRNRIIILNMWQRNKDRVNSNWIITGLPGVGKSSTIKLLFVKELAFGTKFIVFDPEEEYLDLAGHPDIQGDIIDCAGGSIGRINPLQVRSAPKVTQEDLDEGETMEDYIIYDGDTEISDMAIHIQSLRVFFKLYFGSENFTSGVKAVLEENLIELYGDFGITWDTDVSKLHNEDYPIMEDLYKKIKEKVEEDAGEMSSYKKESYERLVHLLYNIGEGADRYIWNGYTTINPKSKFIVLNTSKLLELDENVKRAQFMNLTTWAWQQMSMDRTEKTLLGVDEGYLFVDPEYPDLMKYMRNISKRSRKYEGGLMFITHSVVDILDPAVKRLGQAIIDNACYKFIMGCDGKNLEETRKLFNLSEKEENILAAKNRGQGILFAGSVRLEAKIDIREKFLEMFGKAGGR